MDSIGFERLVGMLCMASKKLKRVIRKTRLSKSIGSFHREFKSQLKTFITGAFAFVAALLWRDAISSFLETYEEAIQAFFDFEHAWISQMITATIISVVAVLAIIVVSKILDGKKN